jgi:hypothetical protein
MASTESLIGATLDELLRPQRWEPKRSAGPELRKALAVIQTEVGETRRLLDLPTDRLTLRTDGAVAELKQLLQQDARKLKIDSAWELAGALKRLNLRLGDEHYTGALLGHEKARNQQKGRWHPWNEHFEGEELARFLDAYRAGRPSPVQHAQAVDRLTFLYLMRAESGRNRRARAALKCVYLTRLAVVLLALLVGAGVATQLVTDSNLWHAVLLTACAGALGSTLSGVLKARDHLVQLDELRGFWPTMRVQPLVGASAGLVVLMLLESGVLTFGTAEAQGWAAYGLLAFVAGFSEPFFLHIVDRVAVLPDRERARESATETRPAPTVAAVPA